jgi:hypothetical protein
VGESGLAIIFEPPSRKGRKEKQNITIEAQRTLRCSLREKQVVRVSKPFPTKHIF